MKKSLLIVTWMVIGWLLVTSLSSSFAYRWQWSITSNSWALSQNFQMFGQNIIRDVKNISNWVEITMTTTDPATLEHLKLMVTSNMMDPISSSSVKLEKSQISNGIKMTMTSTDPATVRSIQDRAASATSWMFGNWWAGRGWMMRWGFWQGQGRWNGGNWIWGCPMFR